MKKVTLAFTALLITAVTFAKGNDILTLNNNQAFKGDVVKIKDCNVVFKSENGEKYTIPANDIQTVKFEDVNNSIYTNYLTMLNADPNSCMKGAADGKVFHGKGGLHVALGVLFGPFAVIGAAVGSPDPMAGSRTPQMSKNSDLFTDPTYLECYKKAARSKNVGMAAAGWGMWIVLLLL
jgi:hypothetical protein